MRATCGLLAKPGRTNRLLPTLILALPFFTHPEFLGGTRINADSIRHFGLPFHLNYVVYCIQYCFKKTEMFARYSFGYERLIAIPLDRLLMRPPSQAIRFPPCIDCGLEFELHQIDNGDIVVARTSNEGSFAVRLNLNS